MRAVRGVARHFVGHTPDADDLCQETFLQAYEKLYQLRDGDRFSGWLRGIATSVALMWLRRQRARSEVSDAGVLTLPDSGPWPDRQLQKDDLRQEIARMLDTLSEGERLATRLFYLEEMSIKEISVFLGISDQAVKSRLHKARKKLRKVAAMNHQPDPPTSIQVRTGDGFLHLHEAGYAFVRPRQGDPSRKTDLYVSQSQIDCFALQEGDYLAVEVRAPK